jgi:hypothetical protein
MTNVARPWRFSHDQMAERLENSECENGIRGTAGEHRS